MKKLLICLSIFYSSFSYSQQAPGIEWQNTIGGNADDYPASTPKLTSDGGYILAGNSNSSISGDKTENNGSNDYWMVKTDAAGIIQWQNTIGGSGYEAFGCIQQTSDGGYILGGSSESNISGDKTENCIGGRDYWIVKTNTLGTIQWQNTIGGNQDDILFSIQQTTDGGYILGGFSASGISGDKTENSNGWFDYWIVKVNSTGTIQWQNNIGGSGNEEFHSIRQTPDGGYILAGFSTSSISGDKTENGYGSNDYWILKTDASGIIQWQNTIGGNGTDELQQIELTSDGGYILAGISNSNISGDKTENCIGGEDYWIVKTDASGNVQWQNTIGGNNFEWRCSVQQTSDGGYILGGLSLSDISGDKTENSNGGWDFWILKTDAIGNIQWQNTIGGSGDDLLYSIELTNDGGYMLGGASQSNISGDKTENSNGLFDFWMVKLYGCVPCPVPTNFSTTNIHSTDAKLNWQTNACATGNVGYKVRYRQIGTTTWIIKTVTGNTGYKVITNLTPNTQYQWSARTKCSTNPNVLSAWSSKINFSTSLRLSEIEEEMEVNIFPNPYTTTATITIAKEGEYDFILTDALGRSVYTMRIIGAKAQIERGNLPSGVYFYYLKEGSHLISGGKVMVE